MPIRPLPDHLPPLIDDDGEVRELTAGDFQFAVPTLEAFPGFGKALENLRRRGPQQSPTKERVGLRLDRAVVDHFRATGPGWQSRINALLLDHVMSAQTSPTDRAEPASRGEVR